VRATEPWRRRLRAALFQPIDDLMLVPQTARVNFGIINENGPSAGGS
jgi:hypothetical protein